MVATAVSPSSALSADGVIPFEGPARIRPIANDEGLARYMETLKRAAYEGGVIFSKLQADIAAMTRDAKAALLQITDASGNPVSIKLGKYISDLLKEIDAYGRVMDRETIEDASGRVARRMSADSLSFIARHPAGKESDDEPTEKDGEKASIAGVMSTIGAAINAVLKKAGLDRFWKFEIKPDLTAAKKALQSGACTPAELTAQGMQLVPGEKRIDISTADYNGPALGKIRDFFA